MCVAQIFRAPFHVDFIGRCVLLSSTIYSTHNHHRYAFISNMQCGIPLLYIRTIKQTNAGDLVNSVYTLVQPAVKYTIKTDVW